MVPLESESISTDLSPEEDTETEDDEDEDGDEEEDEEDGEEGAPQALLYARDAVFFTFQKIKNFWINFRFTIPSDTMVAVD